MCAEGRCHSLKCERYDRPVPGKPLAPSEAAIVTSKRSGVVTMAPIPEMTREAGRIFSDRPVMTTHTGCHERF